MIKPTQFVIKKNGPRRFYWQLQAPNGNIIARGPGRANYMQSTQRCRDQIANIKNNAIKWGIADTVGVRGEN